MAPWGSRPGTCVLARCVLLHTRVTLAGTHSGDAWEEAKIGRESRRGERWRCCWRGRGRPGTAAASAVLCSRGKRAGSQGWHRRPGGCLQHQVPIPGAVV